MPLVPGEGFSAVSHSGTLVVTRFPQSEFRLAWVGRDGTSEFLPLDPGFYHQPALSPDGRRIAVEFGMDVWIYSLDRGTFNRLTFGDSGYWPIWTPDGRYVVYTAPRWRGSPDGGDLFRKRADGSGPEERLTTTELEHSPMSFTPDGKTLVICVYSPTTGGDLWRLRLDGGRKPEPLLRTRFNEGSGMVSPDGRWLAYHSDESGQLEVYVVSFPEPSSKWRVSNAGGFQPLWSPDGRELFYRTDDGTVFAVPVETNPVFGVAGKPRSLFKRNFRRGGRTNYTVTPDGKRFLICELLPESSAAQFEVVVNFVAELQGRARTVK